MYFLESSYEFISLKMFFLFIEKLELDKNNRNRFFKKRCVRGWEEIFYSSVNSYLIFSKPISEEKLDRIFEWFETYIIKIYTHFEYILIQLGLGISIVNYSRADIGTEESKKNTELQLEQAESLYTNRESTNPTMIDQLIISTLKGTRKYIKYAERYILFSIQIYMVKSLTPQLKTKPDHVYQKYIIYNFANTKKFSKFIFNSRIMENMSSQGISIDKQLYSSIRDLFMKKYDLNTQNSDRVRLVAIAETLDEQFLDKDKLLFYSKYFIDFRGRVYSDSVFSVTAVKLLRYIISNENNIVLKENRHYEYLLTFIFLIPKTIREIRKFSTNELIILLIGFLNLGKLLKSKLLKKHYITLETFIKIGIEMYTLDIKTLCTKYNITNVDDIGYLITTKEKLYAYIYMGKSFTIILDSTASGIFHLNIWLRLRNEHLPGINMSNEYIWTDTYTYLFNLIKEKWGDSYPFELEYLFTRKRVKSILMTIPYNARRITLIKYFCLGMSKDEKELIKGHLKKFFDLVDIIFDNIFHTSLKNLKNQKKFNNSLIFTLNNNTYDFNYYNLKTVDVEYKIHSKRFYYTKYVIDHKDGSPIKNNKKANIAFIANVIHATDAAFLEKIYITAFNKDINMCTVHDEFIIPVEYFLEFLDIANQAYRDLYKEVTNETINQDSFFIVL